MIFLNKTALMAVFFCFMKNRNQILATAIDECICELYKWAQPSIDLRNYIGRDDIEDTPENPFYKRYYISRENMKYIVEMFMEAYGVGNKWNEHIEFLIGYITNKDSKKVVYKDFRREYENIIPIQDITKDSEKVLELIRVCKNFYNKDIEKESFNFSLYLGPSPNSNKEYVEEYWKEHGIPDFKIVDYNIDNILYDEDSDEWIKKNLVWTKKQ